ncbi:MAG: hypothetical protein HW383_58, partial [Candidatus Magasanikbacteria bacterium]|nr:hypothetical protein [Candidatus Magasanikbacteria bacterium]
MDVGGKIFRHIFEGFGTARDDDA